MCERLIIQGVVLPTDELSHHPILHCLVLLRALGGMRATMVIGVAARRDVKSGLDPVLTARRHELHHDIALAALVGRVCN